MTTLTVAGPEARTFVGGEFRAEKGSKFFEFLAGRAVPYGSWEDIGGWFLESFAPGSLARTTRDNPRLPLLLFHDSRRFPVGRVDKWVDTEGGMNAVWKMDTAVDAQEAARLARDGMLTGLSVGFVPIAQDLEDRDGREWHTITEARLLEVSMTPTPAYAGAQVQHVRSRQMDQKISEARAGGWQYKPTSAARSWRANLSKLSRVG